MRDRCVVGLQFDVEIAERGERFRALGMFGARFFQDLLGLFVIVNTAIGLRESNFSVQIPRRNPQRFVITSNRLGVSCHPQKRVAELNPGSDVTRRQLNGFLKAGDSPVPISRGGVATRFEFQLLDLLRRSLRSCCESYEH